MSQDSVTILTEHLRAHLERLVVLREYHKNIDDPYVKTALSFTIEDTQEAIARVSSRLRQIGTISPVQISEETSEKLLYQSRSRRSLGDKIRFVYRGLVHQVNWYNSHVKTLLEDPDSQAVLVALAEQARLRLERWESLMAEMKVSA
jgi:hypothetical protein